MGELWSTVAIIETRVAIIATRVATFVTVAIQAMLLIF